MAVPKFGGWESSTMPTDYSMVFATVRENKKQNKIEIGQEDTNIVKNDDNNLISHQDQDSTEPDIPKRRWLNRYFNCFSSSVAEEAVAKQIF